MKSLVAILVFFNFSWAQADYKNPSAAVKAKIQKLALEHVAVKAILASSASIVQMDQKKCNFKTDGILGEEQSGFVSGVIKINQNCSNVALDGGNDTTIEMTISSGRALIDKVEIGYSGF